MMAPSARVHTAPLPPPPPSLPPQHALPLRGATTPTTTSTSPTVSTPTTPPVAVSAPSRNDLFNTSWTPELPPPRPLLPEKHADALSSHGHASSLGPLPPTARDNNNNSSSSRLHRGHLFLRKSSRSPLYPQTPSPPPPPAPALAAAPEREISSMSGITHHNTAHFASTPPGMGMARLQPPSSYSTVHDDPHYSLSHLPSATSMSPRLQPKNVHIPYTPSPPAHSHTLPHLAVHTRSPSDSPPSPTHPLPLLGNHLVASPPASPTRPGTTATAGSGTSSSPVFYGLASGGTTFGNNMTATTTDGPAPAPPSPGAGSKTSSFFESAAADTPPPAPRLSSGLAPSPLSLSRASSLRARALPARAAPSSPPPPLMPDDYNDDVEEALTSPNTSSHFSSHLSPLHQSPNLPSSKAAAPTWNLPIPPAADDIALRLFPDETYLLGEGRHACVYLAAYKRVTNDRHRASGNRRNGLGSSIGLGRPTRSTSTSPHTSPTSGNGNTSGVSDTEWTLCAAKRLAPDRESQTLGLREAFFLNRLSTPAKASRASSPLGRAPGRGRVHVVKLIAVKDEAAAPVSRFSHARSVSDFLKDTPTGSPAGNTSLGSVSTVTSAKAADTPTGSPARRPRSSTIFASGRAAADSTSLSRKAAEGSARLVLVLEHAPLGTLDRLLRTSPGLVGQDLWGRWAREASEALEWVHSRGVVHADVKPSNLLLTADLHLRLSDFGSSLLIHPAHPPTDGVGLGTLPFSPPELVDPNAPFSFPVDIFALGATLYQCITGREPYRGSRPIEMMHHVRNGGLWAWEERERLSLVGTGTNTPVGGESPYPSSAWNEAVPEPAIRRGGSLRVPSTSHRASILPAANASPTPERPRLSRVGSAESIQAANDVTASVSESPAGVKLWHHWIKSGRGRGDPIDRLLTDNPSPPASPTPGGAGAAVSRSSSLRHSVSAASVSRSSSLRSRYSPSSPTGAGTSPTAPAHPGTPLQGGVYADGAPAMYFLGGGRVPEDVRDVLRAMLEPAPEARPTASELVSAWETLAVGVDEEVVEEEPEEEEMEER